MLIGAHAFVCEHLLKCATGIRAAASFRTSRRGPRAPQAGQYLTLVLSPHDKCRDLQSAMTNKTFCRLLKTLVAFAITGIFSVASLAGEFTVQKGKRYRATLSLNSVERLADNALIASKFRAIGFTKVRVSGAGAVRHVEGVWPRK